MKIVEVINSLSYRGGAQVFFFSLCKELAKTNGENLHVIVLYDQMDESFNQIKNLEGIVFHSINKKRSVDFKAAREFRRLINKINPDIINYHLPFLVTYFLSFGFKKTKWKLVKTFHSIPNKDTNRFEIYFEKRYAKKSLLSFIGISDSISEISKTIYPNSIVRTIYNGIEPYCGQNVYNAKYDFVIVASFSQVKNHIFLINTFEKYVSMNPASKLLCVGGGELLSKCVEIVKSKGLSKNVFFVGSQKNVFPFLCSSRAFVLSSIREGNPISILEAISIGLPVIAPNVGGIPDIIENNVNGLLYEINNENQLLHAMRTITEPVLYEEIKTNNIIKSKRYLIEYAAKQYLNYFYDLNENRIKGGTH